ncbi:F-actin-uncapping protein LRRC16A isoform X1 [Salvelinus fontinalis]|uniref:F-actin-uncapping protein LRRC16A isoform X1 n=1 Tax=Salvelinus fontinalis TaxID=8038 RepID=UPI002484FB81|nr:F-actin-uncapping protein LRRC16A isoform X1 [Salvelinus fontinalis]XP_055732334.1 F-actin-uncapping protein LRRC16A isoform X1 [Salvelinus fontinalis]
MAEENTEFPNELLESVRDAVGGKIKLTLKKRVKLEVKGDKLENRVLALASHRGFLLTVRVPTKIEQTFNYLDIQGITSNKPTQLLLKYDRGQLSLKLGSVEDVDEVVAHIGTCLHRICPGLSPVKAMKKLTLMPPERTAALQSLWEDQATTDLGPCGGFSHMYWCLCDQLGLPFREEVQWDVDTIYQTQDTRELNLQDFVHLENRDVVAIILVLEYNQWFTKLSSKDYKLSTDVCEQILRVVARSSRLEEMVLENASLRSDFAQKLANALTCNPASVLHTLNLTNNSLEDKGVSALSAQLAKLPMGLKHLNLSKTSISQKGVNSLAQALSANPAVPTTLTHLDLCGNSFRGDDLPNLYNFLGQPNSLALLDLSHSDCCLDQVCTSLLRGSLKHLSVLNMSKTVFSSRRSKDVPHSFKQFFGTALALRSVNLSGTKLPLEALKALLLGLGCNPNLSEVSLDISSCELRSGGAQILEGCIAEIPNISRLDISDNGLDSDLTTLLVWLARNRSIRHLSLGKNFNNIKSKNLSQVLDNLVHMIQEEESPLTSLSLADSKLKGDLSIVLNALGSNTSLTRVDISGNGMGDMGAKMLAKALQINTKLRTVMWDKNNVSLQGLQDVASALEKNQTIRFMPIPIIDAAQALKASPEKTEDALLKMERYVLRNHETRKYLQEQAYRLQQGIVMTTTQQMMDRICVKVQDHLNSLRYTETDVVQEDMKVAKNLMKDARNSKRLLPNLYHLRGSPSGMGGPPDMGSPIQDKLESMAGEIARVMDEQLQTLLQSMVDTAEGLCPHVMKRSNLHQELMKAGAGKMTVPHSFITTTLLEQSGVDILNKISEVKLSVASFLSDRIVDEILESLSRSQNTLAEHLTRKAQPLLHQEPKETEVLDETVLQPEAQTKEPAESLEEIDTCVMTPKSKRKSILSRMLRPVSVAFEMEFDLDKALEEVPIHEEDSPPPPLSDKMPTYFGKLPTMEARKLEHHTKLRPKPKKRTKPSRAPRDSICTSPPPEEVEQNRLLGKVDEGVDEFFHKKITQLSFKRPTLRGSPNIQEGSEKKRESRKSGFLNLIKSRTSKSEKSHGAAAITTPASATVSTVTEVHLSPKPPLRDHSEMSPDRSEKPPTHEPTVEQHSESDSKGGGWHFGVSMDLLAEMRKMHGKMAAHKSDSSSSSDKADGKQGKPESQTSSISPRSKPTSVTPRLPAPPGTKPHLGPLSPHTSSSHSPDDTPDSPLGNVSPKGPLPAPRLKRAPSDCEREGGTSPINVELTGDSSPFDLDHETDRSVIGGRQWSSLKSSTSVVQEVEGRERTKSLPASERPSSMVDAAHCQSTGVFDEDNTEEDFPPSPDTDQRQNLMPDSIEEEEEEEDTINDIVPV